MKAVRIHEHGGVDKLRYEEAENPRISAPNEVIVKLRAASVNHIDIWVRLGATGIAIPMPHILGGDGAGVIFEVGGEVSNVRPGDAVCLYLFSGCGQCEFCLSHRDLCVFMYELWEKGWMGPMLNM